MGNRGVCIYLRTPHFQLQPPQWIEYNKHIYTSAERPQLLSYPLRDDDQKAFLGNSRVEAIEIIACASTAQLSLPRLPYISNMADHIRHRGLDEEVANAALAALQKMQPGNNISTMAEYFGDSSTTRELVRKLRVITYLMILLISMLSHFLDYRSKPNR